MAPVLYPLYTSSNDELVGACDGARKDQLFKGEGLNGIGTVGTVRLKSESQGDFQSSRRKQSVPADED